VSLKHYGFFVSFVLGMLLFFQTSLAHATVQHYLVDAAGSHLSFSAHSTGHDFQGETSQVSGYFGYDRDQILETGYGEFHIPVRGLQTGIAARDRNMYAHFDADHYPEIVFRLKHLSSVQVKDPNTFALQLIGDLTIKGVTREVSLSLLSVVEENKKIILSGSTPLKMTDFGIDPPGFLFFRVAEDVQISFQVVGRVG